MKIATHCRQWNLLPLILILTALTSCSDSTTTSSQEIVGAASQQTSEQVDLVIEGGQLIDMVGDEPNIVPVKGIVINDGMISSIVAANSSEALPAAE
ncbi:MAG: hypothetical protein GTO60_11130, partial [Gammaproteobacteria bacterium]|nr:hypothetical protein [Gammaproteobacteria bacterium]